MLRPPSLLWLSMAVFGVTPALADTLPQGVLQRAFPGERAGPVVPLEAGDPLGYLPASLPSIPGGASYDRIFDRPVTGGGHYETAAWAPGRGSREDWKTPISAYANNNGGNLQTGGNGGGNNGCGNGNGGPSGRKDCDKPSRPTPTENEVPGPVPVLGAGVAFGWARRMRRRVGK